MTLDQLSTWLITTPLAWLEAWLNTSSSLSIALNALGLFLLGVALLWGHLAFWGWYYRRHQLDGERHWVKASELKLLKRPAPARKMKNLAFHDLSSILKMTNQVDVEMPEMPDISGL